MTEQEAIERIANVIELKKLLLNHRSNDLAQAAWNEMKAIARETAPLSMRTAPGIPFEAAIGHG